MAEESLAQPRYCQLLLTAPTVGEVGVAQEVGVVVGVVDKDVVAEVWIEGTLELLCIEDALEL